MATLHINNVPGNIDPNEHVRTERDSRDTGDEARERDA